MWSVFHRSGLPLQGRSGLPRTGNTKRLSRTRDCQIATFRTTLTARRGYKRAIVATAHKFARALYVMVRDRVPYRDPGTDYEALLVDRNAPAGCTSSHSSAVSKTRAAASSASTGRLSLPHQAQPDPFTAPDQDRTGQPSSSQGRHPAPVLIRSQTKSKPRSRPPPARCARFAQWLTANPRLQAAVIRRIKNMGEVATRLSPVFCQNHPDIP